VIRRIARSTVIWQEGTMIGPGSIAWVSDGPKFIGEVCRIMAGAAIGHRASDLCILGIDHWFGHKWLEFSGKALGAVRVWQCRLTVPP
jgi:hypothetical protein